MAGASGGNDCGWLGSWLQTVKDKSASAMEFVRKDLAEYTCTMQTDTRTVAQTVREGLKEENASTATAKMKKGLGYILGGITHALTVPPDDSDEEEVTVGKDSVSVFDKAKVRLHAIQVDPGTYTSPPDGPPGKFDEWLANFDLDSRKGHISELLVSNVEVRALYTQLVPSEVSHALFWQRYFYKLHHLEKDEERRRELKKRAEKVKSETIGWEDDWEDMAGPNSPPKDACIPRGEAAKLDVEGITVGSNDKNITEVKPRPLIASKDGLGCGVVEPVSGNTKSTDSSTESAPNDESICDNKKPDIPSSVEDRPSLGRDTKIVFEEESKETNSNGREKSLSTEKVKESDPVDDVKCQQPTPVVVKSKVSGDMVVVGRDDNTPTESCGSSNSKESSSLDDDWEKDFDIEVTDEDLKMAQEAAKKISLDTVEKQLEEDDDWENWE